jgi:UTP--glucose-1-phosphate uridylyltransferase
MPPVVKLGAEFSSLAEYRRRVPYPASLDLDNLEQLTVNGDVKLGQDITLKGAVIVVAHNGGCICIPDGAVLEDKVLAGSLQITRTCSAGS